VSEALKEGFDYVIWMDADTRILNPDISTQDMINVMNDKDIVIFTDPGRLDIRNTEWSKAFINFIWEYPNFNKIENPDMHEQGVMNNVYSKNIMKSRERMILLNSFNWVCYTVPC